MLNARRTLWCIFGILFVLSMTAAAFAQQEQQSDSALSQSQFMQIIDRLDKVENNMRDHVDKKIGELDKKIDVNYKELNTKFHELDKEVAVLRSDVDKLFTIIIGIAVAVGAHLLIFIGANIYSYWQNKNKVNTEIATKATENKNEPNEDILRKHLMDSRPSKSELA